MLWCLTGDSADVVISQADIDDEKLAQIEEIVKRKTQTAPENIVITPVVTEKYNSLLQVTYSFAIIG